MSHWGYILRCSTLSEILPQNSVVSFPYCLENAALLSAIGYNARCVSSICAQQDWFFREPGDQASSWRYSIDSCIWVQAR